MLKHLEWPGKQWSSEALEHREMEALVSKLLSSASSSASCLQSTYKSPTSLLSISPETLQKNFFSSGLGWWCWTKYCWHLPFDDKYHRVPQRVLFCGDQVDLQWAELSFQFLQVQLLSSAISCEQSFVPSHKYKWVMYQLEGQRNKLLLTGCFCFVFDGLWRILAVSWQEELSDACQRSTPKPLRH